MTKSTKRKPKTGARTRGGLSAARLAETIEAATVAYDECEQATGWFTVIGDNLDMPFETEVLGVTVTVKRLEIRDDSSIVAVCAPGDQGQAIGLVDLPLSSPKPGGTEWIDAYRLCATASRKSHPQAPDAYGLGGLALVTFASDMVAFVAIDS